MSMDLSPTNLALVSFSALAAITIASATMGFFGGNQMPVEGKTILITGGSEGLGLAAAKQLAAKGAHIIIVSRNVGKLEAALKEVKAAARDPVSQRFHYVSADVSVRDYARPLIAEVIAWNNGQSPDIVWCCAGSSRPELFLEMDDTATMRSHMELNYFGAAEMAHAILREWLAPDAPVESAPRHLILTATVISFFSFPGYASYAPAKAALRSLADVLSLETKLYPQKVDVHLVTPGGILSPGFQVEELTKPGITKEIEGTDTPQAPEEVAELAIKKLEKGQYMIAVDTLGSLMKFGALAGSLRNNWVIDTFMSLFVMLIVWPIALTDVLGKIKKYAKDHGHPSTYQKKQQN